MGVRFVRCLAVMALMALMPSLAHAQSSITGTIRDASGAVLPGVTVEAASPVLIEKVRSTVSDGTGGYRLTELLPGTYSLTFTLPGFATVKRDGVEITGAGVITINQDLKVGDLQETITVTGETPIVDVQSTRRQQVIDDSTINALPATRGYNALVFLVPSVTGGSNQIDLMPAMRIFYSHGGRGNEGRTYVDGLSTGSAFNGGGASGYIIDTANSQEMQVSLSGGLGETEVGGATVNFIPKTGGNSFAGQGFFSTAGEWSQGNNIDDHLRSIGLSQAAALYKNWDVQASVGGPILRDKLWFFANYRDFGSHDDILGMYGNLNAGNANSWTYSPDQNLKARNAVSTNGHRCPSDRAGDAAQQGRVLLRQPARLRRLDAEHGSGRTAVRAATTGLPAARRPSRPRRRAARRARQVAHSVTPTRGSASCRQPGARRPPAGCCSKPASRPTSASGDGWSSRVRF